MKASETKLQLLIEGQKQYVIPLFQRVYGWDKKQWETLWNDIVELYEEPHSKDHFMGSIVTMPTQTKPEGVSKFLLIDGQQRLTTFFILLSVLRDHAKSIGTLSNQIEDLFLFNKYATGNDYFKILPTQGDREYFFRISKGESVENIDSRNQVIDANKFFSKQIRTKQYDIEKLKNILMNNLFIVSITLEKDDNPYRIFESLNYKGLPLTQGDLIRNYFFMRIHIDNQEDIYKKIWHPMQKSLDQFDKEERGKTLSNFIRHFLMKDGKEVKQGDIYSSLKELADKKGDDEIIDYLDEILKYSTYYSKLLDSGFEQNNKIREQLKRLNRIDITTAFPFLLNIYNHYNNQIISVDTFYEILKIVENFIIRRFICGVPTNQLNKIFPSLFKSLETNNIVESLKETLRDKNYPKNKEFKEKFPIVRLYASGDRNEKATIILESLELSYGHKEQVVLDNLTIEHIIPQTLSDSWEKYLGEGWQNTYDIYLHTIGNLTLTAYNTELSNALYEIKKVEFEKSHLELNKYFKDVSRWNEEVILSRASVLTEKASDIWPSLWGEIEPETREKTTGVISSGVTGTKPVSLLICEQRFKVGSWKEVLIKTLEAIYHLDEEKFNSLADEYPNKICKTSNGLRVPHKLANGYYAEVNLSAESIKNFCLQIINKTELTEEDWKVEIRES